MKENYRGDAVTRRATALDWVNHIRSLRREAERLHRAGDKDGARILFGMANAEEDHMWWQRFERQQER